MLLLVMYFIKALKNFKYEILKDDLYFKNKNGTLEL